MVYYLKSGRRSLYRLLSTSFLIAALAPTVRSEDEFASVTKVVRQHCLDCHVGGNEAEAGVDLTDLSQKTLLTNARLTQQLLSVLDKREMPPEESSQPSEKQRAEAVETLRSILHTAAKNSPPITAPIRRMNRFQYNNAVTDLFGLNCVVFTLPERTMRVHRNYFKPASGKMPKVVTVGNRPLGKSQMIEPLLRGVAAFPQDLRAEHGYDNQGDHLSLSPLLMESFLNLGESITQSKDFTPKRVAVWKTLFAPPAAEKELATVVRQRLKAFLTKAFRRPAAHDQVERYATFVVQQIDSGLTFSDAMKSVAAATIASPKFLYLYDRNNDGKQAVETTARVDDFDLASRLSFFLWGSLPDEELLRLASEGKLNDARTLIAQTDRMLRDRKLKRFCDSFPSQWLQLDRIISSIPNRGRFPKFYYAKYRSSMHMQLEPLLLFETVLIENRSILDLIDPDFTYRSNKLEYVYGKLGNKVKGQGSGVAVLNFRRVKTPDRRTGGVITNAAVMTMTSGTERTQPITRGAWVAGVIFNDPPEPPPADVPPLSEKPQHGEEKLTLRERLASHRERADCRGCHEQIDPLGFALENFDPIGNWREQYENGRDIDSAGRLFRQHEFKTVVEFKDAILAEKDQFTRALAGHLMSFALARELGPMDEVALDSITNAVIADDYRMKTLIREIILSEPFHLR
ncbi:MAG: DUF1592 domain-containing protein [Planctomycetaceae bacterium]